MVDASKIKTCPYCGDEVDELKDTYICGNCANEYDTEQEAEECCTDLEEEED